MTVISPWQPQKCLAVWSAPPHPLPPVQLFLSPLITSPSTWPSPAVLPPRSSSLQTSCSSAATHIQPAWTVSHRCGLAPGATTSVATSPPLAILAGRKLSAPSPASSSSCKTTPAKWCPMAPSTARGSNSPTNFMCPTMCHKNWDQDLLPLPSGD